MYNDGREAVTFEEMNQRAPLYLLAHAVVESDA